MDINLIIDVKKLDLKQNLKYHPENINFGMLHIFKGHNYEMIILGSTIQTIKRIDNVFVMSITNE